MPVKAQQISYTYDNSGNRITRQKVISMPNMVKSVEDISESTEEDDTASYEDYVAEAKITIFPNPTRGSLRIDINGITIPAEAKIYLYDISGKMVMQLNAISESNTLDISSQPSGVYIMRIYMDESNSTVWNIIKE